MTSQPPNKNVEQSNEHARSEIVTVRQETLLAYPQGRHQALRALPFTATVCVPVWNEGVVLDRALASLVAQSWRDFAIVIVDNASSDHSHKVACEFADRHENAIVYQCPQSLGRSSLWSRCLDLAFGDYTKLLEAADYLMPAFMGVAVAALQADPETSLVRVGAATLREGLLASSPAFSSSRSMTGPSALVHALTTGNFVGPPSAHLMRRSALKVRGLGYRSDLAAGAALELALRLFEAGDFAYVQDPLVVFDEGVERTSNQCGARLCFRDECEARLSVLRTGGLVLPSRTLIRTINHLSAAFQEFALRAEEEGQGAEIERDFAAALTELSALLQQSVQAISQPVPANTGVEQMLELAERETRAQHYAQAESQLREILAVVPCNPVALGDLGRVCFAKSDIEGARKYFLSALAVDPSLELWPAEVAALGA